MINFIINFFIGSYHKIWENIKPIYKFNFFYSFFTKSSKTSSGVLNPKHFIGRVLIFLTTLSSCFWVIKDQSVFLGKYLRIIPIRFSILPFSQLWYGLQKYAFFIILFAPRSGVQLAFGWAANGLVPWVRSNRLLGGASPHFPLFSSQLQANDRFPAYV